MKKTISEQKSAIDAGLETFFIMLNNGAYFSKFKPAWLNKESPLYLRIEKTIEENTYLFNEKLKLERQQLENKQSKWWYRFFIA